MKKKIIIILVTVSILVFSIGLSSLLLDSATCTIPNNGGSCEGECCKITKFGCIAGPCKVIFKR